jgi:glycopeptide antibiotics resistance protein
LNFIGGVIGAVIYYIIAKIQPQIKKLNKWQKMYWLKNILIVKSSCRKL